MYIFMFKKLGTGLKKILKKYWPKSLTFFPKWSFRLPEWILVKRGQVKKNRLWGQQIGRAGECYVKQEQGWLSVMRVNIFICHCTAHASGDVWSGMAFAPSAWSLPSRLLRERTGVPPDSPAVMYRCDEAVWTHQGSRKMRENEHWKIKG